MIRKYRKKPIIIEAVEWDGTNIQEIHAFCDGKAWHDTIEILKIQTLEGVMQASIGDYIIRGIKGEFYPCKKDIFVNSYDLIEQYIYTREVNNG